MGGGIVHLRSAPSPSICSGYYLNYKLLNIFRLAIWQVANAGPWPRVLRLARDHYILYCVYKY